jgi:transcriptional regulator
VYTPSFNRVDDPRTIRAFIHAHGFATLVTQEGGQMQASHLPVLLDESGEGDSLRGHMARANAQWKSFGGDREVLCLFHGPHSYISPSWYEAKVAVPTWNYAVAHVYGVARVETDAAFVRRVVEDTTSKYESGMPCPWPMDLPEDYLGKMMGAIVAFSIRITRIEAKFKFGQNRSPEDQAKMLRGLEESGDPESQRLAGMIRRQGGGPG